MKITIEPKPETPQKKTVAQRCIYTIFFVIEKTAYHTKYRPCIKLPMNDNNYILFFLDGSTYTKDYATNHIANCKYKNLETIDIPKGTKITLEF